VGILWGTTSGRRNNFQTYESAAQALNLELQSLEVRAPKPDLDGAFQAAAKSRVNAVAVVRTALLTPRSKHIADLALKYRLPSMFESDDFVEAGGLMSYESNVADSFRRAATYVDKILKGTKPADLPIEQPTKFEFVINLKTAKALNLIIPQSVLYRADRVIK
jgi:putative ABC transport system substrate-binding protein